MPTEFEVIRRYFRDGPRRDDVALGVGDDAAVLSVPQGRQVVATVDTLVAGVHFAEDAAPEVVGHKALAVNLSDLAAMGAEPAWFTLALTLPEARDAWLAAFARGLFGLARRYRVALVGGDTTRGPLSVTVQAMGLVPEGAALRRDGARPGDLIYVTGTVGDAGLALRARRGGAVLAAGERAYLDRRLDTPEPRVHAGVALRGLASAVIDISDGLAADLGHVLDASKMGAVVQPERLPLSSAFRQAFPDGPDLALALTAGDDYELCFTVPPRHAEAAEQALAAVRCPCTCVGEIRAGRGLELPGLDGELPGRPGYEHFAGGGAE